MAPKFSTELTCVFRQLQTENARLYHTLEMHEKEVSFLLLSKDHSSMD